MDETVVEVTVAIPVGTAAVTPRDLQQVCAQVEQGKPHSVRAGAVA